jgi:hypothetical protein
MQDLGYVAKLDSLHHRRFRIRGQTLELECVLEVQWFGKQNKRILHIGQSERGM